MKTYKIGKKEPLENYSKKQQAAYRKFVKLFGGAHSIADFSNRGYVDFIFKSRQNSFIVTFTDDGKVIF